MQTPENIVSTLLEEEPLSSPPEEAADVDISPQDVVRGSLVGAKPEDFIWDYHGDYFGRWSTGSGAYYVSWKKLLHKGRPTFLGTVRQIERRQSYDTVDTVPDLGKFYIASVPSHQVTRGGSMGIKRGHERKFTKTRYGHGIVRYAENPQAPGKVFKSLFDASVYLAKRIRPHKYLVHVTENGQGELDFHDEDDIQPIDPNELVGKTRWFSAEKEFAYKRTNELPQDEGLPLDYYEPFYFEVRWKKEKDRETGKPVYLGTLSVEHDERGTPVWGIASLPASLPIPVPETVFSTRFGAARLLKELYQKWSKWSYTSRYDS